MDESAKVAGKVGEWKYKCFSFFAPVSVDNKLHAALLVSVLHHYTKWIDQQAKHRFFGFSLRDHWQAIMMLYGTAVM